jgi:hypothetical protein
VTKKGAMNTEQSIKRLHDEYLRLVGGKLLLTLDRMYWWGQWASHGWGVEDLRTVIGHLQQQIAKGKRYHGALRWSRLIQQADVFEEELILANAERRNAKPHVTPKEQVVQQFRPTVVSAPVKSDAKHVGELIAELKRSAGMKV